MSKHKKKKTKREEFNFKKIQMHLLDSIHRKTKWDKDPYCNELCPVAVWPECIRQSPWRVRRGKQPVAVCIRRRRFSSTKNIH